jgi:M-phase inducer phosphatase 1
MSDLLNGNIKLKNNYQIIDCRFPFEYEGGHLKGSMNIYLADTLEEIFFKTPKDTVLIFHCEFSSNRGPKL